MPEVPGYNAPAGYEGSAPKTSIVEGKGNNTWKRRKPPSFCSSLIMFVDNDSSKNISWKQTDWKCMWWCAVGIMPRNTMSLPFSDLLLVPVVPVKGQSNGLLHKINSCFGAGDCQLIYKLHQKLWLDESRILFASNAQLLRPREGSKPQVTFRCTSFFSKQVE